MPGKPGNPGGGGPPKYPGGGAIAAGAGPPTPRTGPASPAGAAVADGAAATIAAPRPAARATPGPAPAAATFRAAAGGRITCSDTTFAPLTSTRPNALLSSRKSPPLTATLRNSSASPRIICGRGGLGCEKESAERRDYLGISSH